MLSNYFGRANTGDKKHKIHLGNYLYRNLHEGMFLNCKLYKNLKYIPDNLMSTKYMYFLKLNKNG